MDRKQAKPGGLDKPEAGRDNLMFTRAMARPGPRHAPMSDPNTPPHPDSLTIRSFQPEDQDAVQRLYDQGLLAGQIAANDTGADIDNIQEGYFIDHRHHFWVAELDGTVVGMIGVSDDGNNTAEIRRLRVDPGQQHSAIPGTLLETAVNFCREQEYLKVRLDTRFEKDDAVDLFDRIGFQHTRTRETEAKDLLEFYLDLYRSPKPEEE